ncbi:MAG: hypothetical protein VYB79_04855 [Chloroflexota bacterium]|nr:hypothetical protein [Chloroflexota bacterium]
MNFEFSNPLRVNELFRPILQFLVFKDQPIGSRIIEEDVILRIKNTYKKYDPENEILNTIDIDSQVSELLEESIELLISNKLVAMKYPKLDISIIEKEIKVEGEALFYLTDKARIHIQSEESIKFIGANGETLYILDFLP